MIKNKTNLNNNYLNAYKQKFVESFEETIDLPFQLIEEKDIFKLVVDKNEQIKKVEIQIDNEEITIIIGEHYHTHFENYVSKMHKE